MSATLKLTGLLLICGVVFPAHAQDNCNTREAAEKVLVGKYKEAVTGTGLSATGNLVELHESAGGETWTLTVTTPEGLTCVIGAGEYWQAKQASYGTKS